MYFAFRYGLPCKAALIIYFLGVVACGSVSAQTRKVQNRPYLDMRAFHYGFTFGLHQQGLSIENNGHIDPATGEQWFATNARYDAGFSVGVLGEWRINQTLAFRVIPTIHFGNKLVTFRENGSGQRTSQDIKSSYIAAPVNLKIAAPRFNNHRPYVVAGVAPMYDLTVKKQDNLRMKSFDCYVEVGAGCDFYLPFFKFVPELKFCFGLNNLLEKNRSDLLDQGKLVFTESVNRLSANMLVLSLYFE